ncbi:aspartate carbamoyltransferase regulatory subunit [Candidatus Parcubacteria bacterium]|nr:aspartate carbamoyltransferase regulatory subunit [Candidatus Parcubacteria bacterium]
MKVLKVPPIEDGTVIDHLPPWTALTVLRILGINEEKKYRNDLLVTTSMNVKSKRFKRKDFIKIENRELKPEEVDKIAVIAPKATINIIREKEVIKKWKVELPETIDGIISCPNDSCISNDKKEPISSIFNRETIEGELLRFRCEYCGKTIYPDDISKYIK